MNVNAPRGGQENSRKNNAPGLSQTAERAKEKEKKNTLPGAISKFFEIAKRLFWG